MTPSGLTSSSTRVGPAADKFNRLLSCRLVTRLNLSLELLDPRSVR
jgi:hypothetical protein